MKRVAMVIGMLAAMGLASAGAANAGDCYGGYGGGYGAYHGGSFGGYGGGYAGGHGGYARAPVFHDTTHYDYHRPSIQFHRGHVHVTPGHYDVHRTGHWDR